MRANIGASNNFKGCGMIKNKEQMAESIAAVLAMAKDAGLNRGAFFNLEDTLLYICQKLSVDENKIEEYELLMENGDDDGR